MFCYWSFRRKRRKTQEVTIALTCEWIPLEDSDLPLLCDLCPDTNWRPLHYLYSVVRPPSPHSHVHHFGQIFIPGGLVCNFCCPQYTNQLSLWDQQHLVLWLLPPVLFFLHGYYWDLLHLHHGLWQVPCYLQAPALSTVMKIQCCIGMGAYYWVCSFSCFLLTVSHLPASFLWHQYYWPLFYITQDPSWSCPVGQLLTQRSHMASLTQYCFLHQQHTIHQGFIKLWLYFIQSY